MLISLLYKNGGKELYIGIQEKH